MNQTRTILGLLIMIFFAIPALFGIIWAVGLTQAVVSQKMLSELPQEIIAEIPNLVDGVLLAAKDENIDMHPESRIWLQAAAGVAQSPKELLEETGLNSWLQKELSGTLSTVGDILNGRTEARNVWLDLRPLKQALNHPAMERYLLQVVEKLPVCTPEQAELWKEKIQYSERGDDLPPCRPEGTVSIDAVASIRNELSRDIPDQVDFFKNSGLPNRKVNVAKVVMSFTYLLFLIPAVLIIIGALIAARSKSHFFRWSGGVTLIGGGLALGMATLLKQIIPWSTNFHPVKYSPHWLEWNNVVGDHMQGIALIFTRHLVAPVIAVAGAVCVVGLLLFAFSFTFNKEPEASIPATQPPQVG
ncbi:MAG: hypothetical protein JXI33_05590 [Candidatus Aminicenantes bacterium]|nr:hypothetical protein [Candidatus Aminicenantes bacterium]